MTQLAPSDIRKQISELEKVAIMVCDTPAFDKINEAINELKKTHNELTGFARFRTQ